MIPQRIVAIGTSTFFGLYDEKHYGGHIGRLKIWHESQNGDNELYNLGVSRDLIGESTTELLKRIIAEAVVREPDLILLTTGINDIRRFGGKENQTVTSTRQFEKNVLELIVKAKSITKEIIFISTNPIKDKKSSKGDYFLFSDVRSYANITKRVCMEEKIPYIDIFALWEKENFREFLCPDGVHPNEKGYENIFQTVKSFLVNLYR